MCDFVVSSIYFNIKLLGPMLHCSHFHPILHDKSIGLVLSNRIIDLKLELWLMIMLLHIHENFNV